MSQKPAAGRSMESCSLSSYRFEWFTTSTHTRAPTCLNYRPAWFLTSIAFRFDAGRRAYAVLMHRLASGPRINYYYADMGRCINHSRIDPRNGPFYQTNYHPWHVIARMAATALAPSLRPLPVSNCPFRNSAFDHPERWKREERRGH